jgi:multidrug resistance protein
MEPSPTPLDPKKKKILLTVAFTLFLDLAGFGIILPNLPLYAEDLGASATLVALLSTAFSLAQFVMAPVLGRLSDRVGRRPVMLISIAGGIVANLVLGFSTVIWMVFAARLVAGASKANVSTAQAYVGDIIEPKQRAKYMGMMGAAIGMGFIMGPVIGGLCRTDAFPTLPFFVSAALSAANWIMAYAWLPETRFLEGAAPAATPKPRVRLRDFLAKPEHRPVVLLSLITFLFFISFAAMESVFALFSQAAFGWQERHIGFYLGFIGVNIVITQGVLVGKFVDRFREAKTLAIGTVVLALGLTAVGASGVLVGATSHAAPPSVLVFGPGFAVLILGAVGIAVGNGFLQATISALISRASGPDTQGRNMGLKESAAALARISGPIVAGPLFDHVHPSAPFFAAGVIAAINLLLARMLITDLRRHGIDE